MRTLARAAAAALAIVTAAALGGCATIPTSGGVQVGDVNAPDTGEIYVQAYGPSAGAAPQEIVNGFLRAQAAGVFDDYAVAKEYLTSSAAAVWDPSVRTTVYSGEPTFTTAPLSSADAGTAPGAAGAGAGRKTSKGGKGTKTGGKGADGATQSEDPGADPDPDGSGSLPDGTSGTLGPDVTKAVVSGQLSLAAGLSKNGVLTEASSNATQDVAFTLVRTAGQWRIDNVDNGTLVSLPNFTSTYRPVSLEFLSPDHLYLVPDVRWYPQRNLATYAVTGLLAGPVDWLRDSVTTAIPDGTTLAISAVSVDSEGVATVDLSTEILAASTSDRALVMAQVDETLSDVPEVRSVRFQADGATMSMPDAATVQVDPIPADTPTVVSGGAVGELVDGTFKRDPSVGSVTSLDVTALAVEPTTKGTSAMVVVRAGDDRLAVLGSLATGPDPRTVLTGNGLVAPSVDRFGWIWSAVKGTGLVAVSGDGKVIDLAVPWLEGRTIHAVRVSHDGARIVVVSSGGGSPTTHIEIAGIVRDKTGAPTSLGATANAIGAPVVSASQVVWVDDQDVAVLGRVAAAGSDAVQVVPLAGWTESQAVVDHASSIAAARGVRSIYVLTSGGELLTRGPTGVNWYPVTEGVSMVAYPG